jgi:hypothetical protein
MLATQSRHRDREVAGLKAVVPTAASGRLRLVDVQVATPVPERRRALDEPCGRCARDRARSPSRFAFTCR